MGILWIDFVCTWNPSSIVLLSWGNTFYWGGIIHFNECFMDISDQVLFLSGSYAVESPPSSIYW